jgi:hypothetical protein
VLCGSKVYIVFSAPRGKGNVIERKGLLVGTRRV